MNHTVESEIELATVMTSSMIFSNPSMIIDKIYGPGKNQELGIGIRNLMDDMSC
jgi:hypothetical protein